MIKVIIRRSKNPDDCSYCSSGRGQMVSTYTSLGGLEHECQSCHTKVHGIWYEEYQTHVDNKKEFDILAHYHYPYETIRIK